jgi:two-component system, chemotaxis family, sensor kinase CheA
VFKEFIKDFLAESREILARLDEDFVAVERDPDDAERLDSIYGGVHTIKGSAGFFAFSKLEALAHAGESLLSQVTEGKVRIDETIISPLLSMVDAIREMLDQVEATGGDGENEYPDLVAALKTIRVNTESTSDDMDWETAQREATTELAVRISGESASDMLFTAASELPPVVPPELPRKVQAEEPLEVQADEPLEVQADEPLEVQADEPLEDQAEEPPAEAAAPPEAQQPAVAAVTLPTAKPDPTAKGTPTPATSGTIRVSVSLLDELMSLVGELVLARNQVMQYGVLLEDRTPHGFLPTVGPHHQGAPAVHHADAHATDPHDLQQISAHRA